jgi:carboxymethylenebutenolidase
VFRCSRSPLNPCAGGDDETCRRDRSFPGGGAQGGRSIPDRIVADASLYGDRLGADAPDSPHHLAPKTRAKLHIGLDETDDWMTPELVDRLTAALHEAGVDYQAEVYPGTRHGWAVADTPVYQREGAEHHWDRLLALFRATLQTG